MTRYFMILETTLVKGESDDSNSKLVNNAFAFKNGDWQSINPTEINDRIMGYDPTEDDPCYGIGNKDIMDEIQEISKEKAMQIIAGKSQE